MVNDNYKLDVYQSDAMFFRMDSANAVYALMNLAGEVGELLSLEAKGVRDGYKPNYKENVAKELGDILWCVAAVAADNGFKLSDIAVSNIAKLQDRKERNVLNGSGDWR